MTPSSAFCEVRDCQADCSSGRRPQAFGRFEVVHHIGGGTFGQVYKAWDPRLEVHVAVKALAVNFISDSSIRERFIKEARLTRALAGSGMVRVHDIDEQYEAGFQLGRPYLVMEYCERGTLADRLDGLAERPNVEEGMGLVEAIGDCTGPLHRSRENLPEGVVHRDLKPSNYLLRRTENKSYVGVGSLLRPDEELVVGDLGIARTIDREGSELTLGGGTFGWSAPEQFSTDPIVNSSVNASADVYAVSAIIVWALTGRKPDRVSGPKDLAFPAADLERTGPLAHELRRGLSYDAAARHSTISEWRDALRAAYRSTGEETVVLARHPRIADTGPPGQAPATGRVPSFIERLLVAAKDRSLAISVMTAVAILLIGVLAVFTRDRGSLTAIPAAPTSSDRSNEQPADDGTSSTSVEFNVAVTTIGGTQTTDDSASDDEDGSSTSSSTEPAQENRAPTAQAAANTTTGSAPLDVSFMGSGTDPDDDSLTYLWNFGDGSTANTQNTSYRYTTAGTYQVTLTVSDGTDSANDTISITVTEPAQENRAPTAQAAANTTTGSAPLDVSFMGSGTDPDDDSLTYLWNFGDGSTANTQNTSYRYTTAGTYQVTLTVSDGTDSANDTISITVTEPAQENRAPTAQAAANTTTGSAPLDVSFMGSGTDPDDDSLTYLWNFGDGSTANTQNTSYRYTTAGTYQVTLTVSDGTDSANDTISITVTEPPQEKVGLVSIEAERVRYEEIGNNCWILFDGVFVADQATGASYNFRLAPNGPPFFGGDGQITLTEGRNIEQFGFIRGRTDLPDDQTGTIVLYSTSPTSRSVDIPYDFPC